MTTPPARGDGALEALAEFLDREPDIAPQLPTTTAGPEMDAEIERVVFGGRVYQREGFWRRVIDGPHYPGAETIPPYSTDLAASWSIVEHMRNRWELTLNTNTPPGGQWRAEFFDRQQAVADGDALADTAPLSICRAALDALGEPAGGGEED